MPDLAALDAASVNTHPSTQLQIPALRPEWQVHNKQPMFNHRYSVYITTNKNLAVKQQQSLPDAVAVCGLSVPINPEVIHSP